MLSIESHFMITSILYFIIDIWVVGDFWYHESQKIKFKLWWSGRSMAQGKIFRGGLMVSVLTFSSDDSSLNPANAQSFTAKLK